MEPNSREFARRQISILGGLAMLAGLLMVVIELRTSFITQRLGPFGRLIILACGVFFSVWGLKEVIAGLFPSMRRSGIGRHRFRVPREGQIYLCIMLVLFIGAMIGRSNPLLLVFSIMAGPFIVNGWLTFSQLKRLELERVVPPRVMAGEPVSIALRLTNHKWWLSAWLMLVEDTVANSRESLSPTVLFVRTPPGRSQSGQYTLRLAERGRYTFGPLQVRTRFPTGLVERGLYLNVPDEILVYPRLGRLFPDWEERMHNADQLATRSRPRSGHLNDEFHQLRMYRPGDDLRAIHWKTSARHTDLMVREFQVNRDQELAILLDAWQPTRFSEELHPETERAISLAATICAEQARHGREMIPLLVTNGEPPFRWGESAGTHRIETLLDGLARLHPSPAARIDDLLDAAVQTVSRRHKVLLISARPEAVHEAIGKWTSDIGSNREGGRFQLEVLGASDAVFQRLVQNL